MVMNICSGVFADPGVLFPAESFGMKLLRVEFGNPIIFADPFVSVDVVLHQINEQLSSFVHHLDQKPACFRIFRILLGVHHLEDYSFTEDRSLNGLAAMVHRMDLVFSHCFLYFVFKNFCRRGIFQTEDSLNRFRAVFELFFREVVLVPASTNFYSLWVSL